MSDRRVSVVLLNWNEHEVASRCLDRVLASEGVAPDVLVVDNGSAGDDVTRFRARLGEARVLATGANLGYAGGMNAGLRFWREAAPQRPVLLITPDAAIGPDTLRLLLDELERTPDAGIVGPVVVQSAATGWISAGGTVDRRRVRTHPRREVAAAQPYDADWIDGCCMLLRTAALRDLGDGFDERYFIYFEETDLCCRARQASWRVRVVPGARIAHPKSHGTLPPYYFYYMVRNRYLYWSKNHGVGALRVGVSVALATARSWGAALRSLVVPARRCEWPGRLRDARLQLRAAWVGTRDHFRRRYGRMPDSTMPPPAG